MQSYYQLFLELFGLRADCVSIDIHGVATVNDPASSLKITFSEELTPSVVQDNLLDPKYEQLNQLYAKMDKILFNFKGVREMYRHTTEDTLRFSTLVRGKMMNATFRET